MDFVGLSLTCLGPEEVMIAWKQNLKETGTKNEKIGEKLAVEKKIQGKIATYSVKYRRFSIVASKNLIKWPHSISLMPVKPESL